MNAKMVELLKEARKNRGLLQKDVADLLGIKNNTLSDWERGRTEPDIDTFIRLCEIYNVKSSDLLNQAYGAQETGITSQEMVLVRAYRAKPEMQPAVDKLLGIDSSEDNGGFPENSFAELETS